MVSAPSQGLLDFCEGNAPYRRFMVLFVDHAAKSTGATVERIEHFREVVKSVSGDDDVQAGNQLDALGKQIEERPYAWYQGSDNQAVQGEGAKTSIGKEVNEITQAISAGLKETGKGKNKDAWKDIIGNHAIDSFSKLNDGVEVSTTELEKAQRALKGFDKDLKAANITEEALKEIKVILNLIQEELNMIVRLNSANTGICLNFSNYLKQNASAFLNASKAAASIATKYKDTHAKENFEQLVKSFTDAIGEMPKERKSWFRIFG